MTSKLSFSSLLKEDRKHRQWVPVLAGVVYFIGLLVAIMILQDLQQQVRNSTVDMMNPNSYATRRIANLILGGENPALIAVSIVGAIICGFEGFHYLLNSREVDYYHALPVKRETHFAVKWINGFLFYLIPYAAFLAMSALFTAIFGLITPTFGKDLIMGFLENVLIFQMVYNVVIAVVMISGQPVIAGGGMIIAAFYMIAVRYLVPAYTESFFNTYVNAGGVVLSKLEYLSIPHIVFNLFEKNGVSYVIAAIVISVAACMVAYICYKKRPLEAAGSAIAFPVLKPIIRVMLVLPITLYVTWGFVELAPAAKIVWAIVSAIVFTGLIHALIEVLFEFDLKAAFHHKVQLVACIVGSILFVCFFLADPMDMDHRIPNKGSVDEIYVSLYTGNDFYIVPDGSSWPSSIWGDNYALENVKVTGENMQLIYDLIATSKPYDELPAGNPVETFRVNFKMKNGMVSERRFTYGIKDSAEELCALLSCDEFRETHYQIGTLPADSYSKMVIEDAAAHRYERAFTKEEIASFIKVFSEEVISRDAKQELTENPIGQIRLYVELSEMPCYTIYSCDKVSIEWLKAHDIDLTQSIRTEEITSAVVRKLGSEEENQKSKEIEYYEDGYYEEEVYDSPASNYFVSTDNTLPDQYYDSDVMDSFYQREFYWKYPVKEVWVVNDIDELSMLTPYLKRYDYLDSSNYQLGYLMEKPEYVVEIRYSDPSTGNITVESYVTDAEHLPKNMERLILN